MTADVSTVPTGLHGLIRDSFPSDESLGYFHDVVPPNQCCREFPNSAASGMSSRSVDMLEWMLGSTQGSHAHALGARAWHSAMVPGGDLSQLERLEGVRSAAKHRLPISTMLSAAPWPTMLEIAAPPLRAVFICV